jgi:hypothetical protein
VSHSTIGTQLGASYVLEWNQQRYYFALLILEDLKHALDSIQAPPEGRGWSNCVTGGGGPGHGSLEEE